MSVNDYLSYAAPLVPPAIRALQGMRITEPNPRETVTSTPVTIKGTYRFWIYPHVRLFTRVGQMYFPHDVAQPDVRHKTWLGNVHVNLSSSNDAIVLIVDCSKDIQSLIKYYWAVRDALNELKPHCQGLPDVVGIPMAEPPPGFNILDQISLKKPAPQPQ